MQWSSFVATWISCGVSFQHLGGDVLVTWSPVHSTGILWKLGQPTSPILQGKHMEALTSSSSLPAWGQPQIAVRPEEF